MDKSKGSRELRKTENVRKSRTKKRKQYFNPKTVETDESSFSTFAKKIKIQEDIIVPQDNSIEYRILNFITVFAAISNFVKCKVCNGDIKFQAANMRGLGFNIIVICETCAPQSIPSCPYIGRSYEINRRFIFTMRVLGLGLKSCQKFCGLMDMPHFIFQTSYDITINNILNCVKEVSDKLFKNAVNEEKKEACKERNIEETNELTVSGDGTWKKRGFTSLYGVSSIIGYYSGKILDILVKSSYCKACEYWNKKQDTDEYAEWFETHSNNCLANHEGSSGKMEVDAIVEMFKRSQNKYGVKYINYIGDGDSKTYNDIIKSSPYGDDTSIIKKECIGHVQKRMGHRLRECKKKNKNLGGKNKLTGKMIDKLTVYYGLAIRRNCDSTNKMRDAIWATYYHYSSTDEHPQHSKCPTGVDSWCAWQCASAKGELASFKHDYNALPKDVLDAIEPIYKDLSKQELLERCVGGFNQNNNESYNQLIWKISPKIIPSGLKPIELAAYTSACIFNEGSKTLLQMFEAMGVHSGPNAHQYVITEDANRMRIADDRALQSTREARMLRRQQQLDILEASTSGENLLYGPGIDDFV
ncbi:uncharacterized protein LOC118647367 [Monomorium pharaonis]|uniref:uncharacterized protein LOC118647367 n=1 Tax=Monomorium pharaonis TaxID=307658 RepID=UPI00174707A7|nr:uncharacterized protein LOC118647367 [Monomorium pharaonis]